MIGVALLVIPLAVALLIFHQKCFHNGRRLPPGPIRWPIVGSLPQMLLIHPTYSHIQLSGLAKKYGEVCSLGLGTHYAVVVSSFEALKNLFKRPETNFERIRFDFLEPRSFNKNLGIIWSYGEKWKEQRKFTIKHLRDFGFGRKQSMDETMRDEVNNFIVYIEKEINVNGGIWKVDHNRISAVQINILWASVGGYRFDPESSKTKRHLEINKELFEFLGPKNLLSAFPFLKFFPGLSGYKRQCEIYRECQLFTKELIADAKERRRGRIQPESFVEFFLDEIEENKNNPDSPMNEEQLIVTVMDLFLAGSDTTSTVMHWIILYLALFQNVQERARQEMRNISNNGTIAIHVTARIRMPYVRAIISEVMRHAPILAPPPPRRVSEDIEYGEYVIPKGTALFFNFYPVFHEKAYWGDPQFFRPERFFEKNGTTLDAGKVERVAQFGFGRRMCMGESMALDVLFMMTVGILTHFSLNVVEGMETTLELNKPSLSVSPRPYSLKVKTLD